MSKRRLFTQWLWARRAVLLYVAVVFACFITVYALYGYGDWGVAGYAVLLSAAVGVVLAIWDFVRFAVKHAALARIAGQFPTAPLPETGRLIERDYGEIITALEAERTRLERESENHRRDAEEYYTLWAHQIKTPMAAMRLLLQSGSGGADTARDAELEQELFRIEQYVGMVLQYQRLSSIESDLLLERHTLASLVNRAAKQCAPLFIHKGLSLDTNGVHGDVVTDEKWFCFVLEQLLTNAAKYTKVGMIRVYSDGGETLVVDDPGVGIAPDDLPRVFERGFTGTIGRSERSSTGIGLYLCRRVLARLGFAIAIESQLGHGTHVQLALHQQALDLE